MATTKVTSAQVALVDTQAEDASKRLHLLQQLCNRIATDLMGARNVLRNNAEDASVAYLVADALDRVGWIADQATVVAGSKRPSVGGDADGWLLNGLLAETLGGDHV